MNNEILPQEIISEKIYKIRNTDVMLDADLAKLYGVETRQINQAVSRNADRFPKDFMFECSEEEWESLRSQNVTLKSSGRGQHRKFAPKVFTEQGVYMLATMETKYDKNSQIAFQALQDLMADANPKEIEDIGFERPDIKQD